VPAFGFKLKLLLAMMLVVGGVSVSTLIITQRHVQATYQRLYSAQFNRQIAYFLSLQESRLSSVKDLSLSLSSNAQMIAALTQKPIARSVLYNTTNEEERLILGSLIEERKLVGTTRLRKIQTMIFRFLDSSGKMIQPLTNSILRFGMVAPKRIEQRLSLLRGAIDSPERQQVGYLSMASLPPLRPQAQKGAGSQPGEETNAILQEVIVTKFIDPQTERLAGMLVVGFPIPDLVPLPKGTRDVSGDEPIRAGILLEDHLYADPAILPEPLASEATTALTNQVQTARKDRDEFDWQFQNVHYRMFYQLLNAGSALPPAYQVCLYSLEESLSAQRDLRWVILGTGGAVLAVALLLSVLLAHGFSVPIRDLVRGTAQIQSGDFQYKVPVRSRDELGRLATSFNDMAEGLAQKERYRTILNQVADERIAEELIAGKITLGGEIRNVSVLFCDIRGFTALTENMPPVQVIEMLNEHMSALLAVVKQYNGTLDKFVGDLLMVLFGAPVSNGTDPLDAARCALHLLAERERLNHTSHRKLQIGIGLATGEVVAGGMGSADRLNYTVLGKRVNLASRLCDEARPGEILIDQTTLDLLGKSAIAEPAPPMSFKGFTAPVEVYKLRGLESVPVAEIV
jgi:class 3 adenylate cyclase